MKTDKEEFFIQIYKTLKDKIFRLCLGYTGNPDDAKDLFQEILLLIWNNLESFRNQSHIYTWVYRIASNRAILYTNRKNRLNKLHQDANISNSNISIEFDELEQKYLEEEKIKQLYTAISSLQEMDRIIIGLLLEGCSYQEISEITGLSISHVGVKINRIKKILISKLKSYEQHF